MTVGTNKGSLLTNDGGGNARGIWSPLALPANPHPSDLEFNNDGVWSGGIFDPGGVVNTINIQQAQLNVIVGGVSASSRWAGAYVPIPGAEFTVTTYVNFQRLLAANTSGIALALGGSDIVNNPTTAAIRTIEQIVGTNNDNYALTRTFPAYNSNAPTAATLLGATWGYIPFLSFRVNNNVVISEVSSNGRTWFTLVSTTLAFTPAYVCMFVNSREATASMNVGGCYDFLRFTNSSAYSNARIGRLL